MKHRSTILVVSTHHSEPWSVYRKPKIWKLQMTLFIFWPLPLNIFSITDYSEDARYVIMMEQTWHFKSSAPEKIAAVACFEVVEPPGHISLSHHRSNTFLWNYMTQVSNNSWKNRHLLFLKCSPAWRRRSNTFHRFLVCSSLVLPVTKISSMKTITPCNLWKTCAMAFYHNEGAVDMPNSSLV